MGKKTPQAPDYTAAAEKTAASNEAMLNTQTQANRPNQVTPFGNINWTKDSSGNWTQTTSLSPQEQQALDSQMGIQQGRSDLAGSMMGRSADEYSKPMDWSQFGDFQKLEGNPDDIRKSVSDTMYKQATSRLDPQWQQQQEQTISQLRNQGLKPGDKAYDTAMDNMNRQKTDAYNQANYSSITGGGAEAQREQQMAGTAAGFNNTTRQAQIAEDMQKRGFSLNEINAILSGQQVGMPSAPGFTNAGVAQGVNYSGAAASQYQAATDAANIQNAGMNSLMSGIGGAAGTAAMMSDIKLKRFITYLFTSAGRHFYAWRWVWGGTGTGVLAQENLDIAVPHPSGFLAVDYGRI